jgi:hypothetical protein
MISSQDKILRLKQDPDTLLAIREWLIKNPRTDGAPAPSDEGESPHNQDDTSSRELHAPDTTFVDNLIDSDPLHADSAHTGIGSDSPSIAPAEPLIDPKPSQAQLSATISGESSIVAKRPFHIVVQGLAVIAMIGIIFVPMSARDHGTAVRLPNAGLQANLSQGSDIAAVFAPTLTPTNPRNPVPEIQAVTASNADLRARLETITSNLAAVQRLVQHLTARQDQMSQEIASLQQIATRQNQIAAQLEALQAAEQNTSEKVLSLSRSMTDRPRPRRKVLRYVSRPRWNQLRRPTTTSSAPIRQ